MSDCGPDHCPGTFERQRNNTNSKELRKCIAPLFTSASSGHWPSSASPRPWRPRPTPLRLSRSSSSSPRHRPLKPQKSVTRRAPVGPPVKLPPTATSSKPAPVPPQNAPGGQAPDRNVEQARAAAPGGRPLLEAAPGSDRDRHQAQHQQHTALHSQRPNPQRSPPRVGAASSASCRGRGAFPFK